MDQADDQKYGAFRYSEDEGRPAIEIGGVIQSVAPVAGKSERGYWWAMLPDQRPRRALILGLGGGTVAQLLTMRFGPIPIVGVDQDPSIVALAQDRLGLSLENLKVVIDDAFVWVPLAVARGEQFDYVAVDLFLGPDLARGSLARPFVKSVRSLLSPSGVAVFNLMLSRRLPRQIQRLCDVFGVARAVDDGLNVAMHCRK